MDPAKWGQEPTPATTAAHLLGELSGEGGVVIVAAEAPAVKSAVREEGHFGGDNQGVMAL